MANTYEPRTDLADRLLSRSDRGARVGTRGGLFARLGLSNPFEGGQVQDAALGQPSFSFLRSREYLSELRGLTKRRFHLLDRISGIESMIRRQERLRAGIGTQSVRMMALGSAGVDPTFIDWSSQVDDVLDEADSLFGETYEAPEDLLAASRAEERDRNKQQVAERILRADVEKAQAVLDRLESLLQAQGAPVDSDLRQQVRVAEDLPAKDKALAVRKIASKLRSMSSVASRRTNNVARRAAVGRSTSNVGVQGSSQPQGLVSGGVRRRTAPGSRPMAAAAARTAWTGSAAAQSTGLRTVLADSPSVRIAAESHESAPSRRALAAAQPRRSAAPTALASSESKDLPVAGVVSQARNQDSVGRAGPPSVGAELQPFERGETPLFQPTVPVPLSVSRPTSRIAERISTDTSKDSNLAALRAPSLLAGVRSTPVTRAAIRSASGMVSPRGGLTSPMGYIGQAMGYAEQARHSATPLDDAFVLAQTGAEGSDQPQSLFGESAADAVATREVGIPGTRTLRTPVRRADDSTSAAVGAANGRSTPSVSGTRAARMSASVQGRTVSLGATAHALTRSPVVRAELRRASGERASVAARPVLPTRNQMDAEAPFASSAPFASPARLTQSPPRASGSPLTSATADRLQDRFAAGEQVGASRLAAPLLSSMSLVESDVRTAGAVGPDMMPPRETGRPLQADTMGRPIGAPVVGAPASGRAGSERVRPDLAGTDGVSRGATTPASRAFARSERPASGTGSRPVASSVRAAVRSRVQQRTGRLGTLASPSVTGFVALDSIEDVRVGPSQGRQGRALRAATAFTPLTARAVDSATPESIQASPSADQRVEGAEPPRPVMTASERRAVQDDDRLPAAERADAEYTPIRPVLGSLDRAVSRTLLNPSEPAAQAIGTLIAPVTPEGRREQSTRDRNRVAKAAERMMARAEQRPVFAPTVDGNKQNSMFSPTVDARGVSTDVAADGAIADRRATAGVRSPEQVSLAPLVGSVVDASQARAPSVRAARRGELVRESVTASPVGRQPSTVTVDGLMARPSALTSMAREVDAGLVKRSLAPRTASETQAEGASRVANAAQVASEPWSARGSMAGVRPSVRAMSRATPRRGVRSALSNPVPNLRTDMASLRMVERPAGVLASDEQVVVTGAEAVDMSGVPGIGRRPHSALEERAKVGALALDGSVGARASRSGDGQLASSFRMVSPEMSLALADPADTDGTGTAGLLQSVQAADVAQPAGRAVGRAPTIGRQARELPSTVRAEGQPSDSPRPRATRSMSDVMSEARTVHAVRRGAQGETRQLSGIPEVGGRARYEARIVEDSDGRAIRTVLVDTITGETRTESVEPTARARMAEREARGTNADGPVRTLATGAPEMGITGQAVDTRPTSSASSDARQAVAASRRFAAAVDTVGTAGGPATSRGADRLGARMRKPLMSSLDVLAGTDAPTGLAGPELQRRTWNRRAMASELGTTAPVLASAEFSDAPQNDQDSPNWLRRATTGTAAGNAPGPVRAQALYAADPARPGTAQVAGRAAGMGAANLESVAPEERGVWSPAGLMGALARTETPEDLIRVIVERQTELRTVRGELPAEAVRIVQRIAELPADQVDLLTRGERLIPAQPARSNQRTPSAKLVQPSRQRRNGSEFTRLSSTKDGLGANRVMKLADKLMGLIHLAENANQRDVQNQVRMSSSATEALGEAAGRATGMSSESHTINLESLQASVLKYVQRYLDLNEDREG